MLTKIMRPDTVVVYAVHTDSVYAVQGSVYAVQGSVLTSEVLVEGENDVEEGVGQLIVGVLLWWILYSVQQE